MPTVRSDYSEIDEAARLCSNILAAPSGPRKAVPRPRPEPKTEPNPPASPAPELLEARLANSTPMPLAPPPSLAFRADRLQWLLAGLCRRAGFVGGVVADSDGLLLAEHNSAVGAELVAAFTTVLGVALDKAGRLLGQHQANNMSLDINFTEKVVLRSFTVSARAYYLMVVCAQSLDERSEIELSIQQIAQVLAGGD